MDLDVHFVGDRVSSAAVGNVVVNLYRATPTAEDIEALADAQRVVARRCGRKLVVISIPLTRMGLPDADARESAARIVREIDESVAAAATILDFGGFWASAVISLINTIELVSRGKRKSRAFRSRRDALEWVLPHCDAGSTRELAEQIERAVRALEIG